MLRVLLVRPEILAFEESQVLSDLRVREDRPEILVDVDRKVRTGLKVPGALQDHQATKVCLDPPAVRVRKAILVKKVRLVLLEFPASKGLPVLKVSKAYLELLAPRALKDQRVKPETLDLPVLLDKTALM